MELIAWRGKVRGYERAEAEAMLELYLERYRHGVEVGFPKVRWSTVKIVQVRQARGYTPKLESVISADKETFERLLLKEAA